MSIASSCVCARPLSIKYLAVRCNVPASIVAFILLAPKTCVEVIRFFQRAVIDPFVLAAILIDTEIRRTDGPFSEVWEDNRDVSRHRNHWISFVRRTLKSSV